LHQPSVNLEAKHRSAIRLQQLFEIYVVRFVEVYGISSDPLG
jgi:hypothetical protein